MKNTVAHVWDNFVALSTSIEASPHQFDDRLPKLKLKIFSHLKHQVKSVYKYKDTFLNADHKLFG